MPTASASLPPSLPLPASAAVTSGGTAVVRMPWALPPVELLPLVAEPLLSRRTTPAAVGGAGSAGGGTSCRCTTWPERKPMMMDQGLPRTPLRMERGGGGVGGHKPTQVGKLSTQATGVCSAACTAAGLVTR